VALGRGGEGGSLLLVPRLFLQGEGCAETLAESRRRTSLGSVQKYTPKWAFEIV